MRRPRQGTIGPKWVRQPILAVLTLSFPLSDLHPSFTSLELALLRSSSCYHVAQCPNIYNSLWQVQGERGDCVTLLLHHPITLKPSLCPGPPARCLTHIPVRSWCSGLLAPEAAAVCPARNASCSKVWSIRVTAKSGATVLLRDKNTSSQICIEHLPALGWTLNTIKNRELTTTRNTAESRELVHEAAGYLQRAASRAGREPASHLGTPPPLQRTMSSQQLPFNLVPNFTSRKLTFATHSSF